MRVERNLREAATRLAHRLRSRLGPPPSPRLDERIAGVARIAADVAATSPGLPEGVDVLVVSGTTDPRFGPRIGAVYAPAGQFIVEPGFPRDRALLDAACRDATLRGPPGAWDGASRKEVEIPVVRPPSAILRAGRDKGPALARLRDWLASDPDRPDGERLLAMVDAEIAAVTPRATGPAAPDTAMPKVATGQDSTRVIP